MFIRSFIHSSCFRGTASHGKAPFRGAYSRVGNVKAILSVPILCLTATASTKLRKKIIKMLNMSDVKTVRMTPDKENVKYVIQRAKSELQETFLWLIKDIIKNKEHTEKTVLFCQSFKACGDIYETFQHNLPNTCTNTVAMFHSKTPKGIKDGVIADLMSEHGAIRLVIATSALGMGVNIPYITRVIHFGVPESMESYLQGIGRGGRDGSDVVAIMYYHGYHLCHCDPTMRAFAKNTAICRHKEIVKFFNAKVKKPTIPHKCCDVCTKSCNCGSCPEEIFNVSTDLRSSTLAVHRQVTDDERHTFRDVVLDLSKGFKSNISVLGTQCFQDVLNDGVIADLAEDLEHLFSVDYILQNFAILNERLAAKILVVVNDIFNDLEESAYLMELCEQDWDDQEQFFLSVPEQTPPDDSDENSDTDL